VSRLSIVFLCVLLLGLIQAAGQGVDVEDLPPGQDLCLKTLDRLALRHEGFQTLKARFVSTLRAPALDQREREEGSVLLARGGYSLWEYDAPEGKRAWSDGVNSHMYLPGEHQVLVMPLEHSLPALLLLGEADIRDVVSCDGAYELEGRITMTLALKRRDPSIRNLTVEVDTADSGVRLLSYEDALGNQISFAFSDVRWNEPVSPDVFRIPIPENARILRQAVDG